VVICFALWISGRKKLLLMRLIGVRLDPWG
jgi:hypothetical protein